MSPRPPQAEGWVTSVLAPEYFIFTFHCSRKSVWPGMGLRDSARKQERERAGPGGGGPLWLWGSSPFRGSVVVSSPDRCHHRPATELGTI